MVLLRKIKQDKRRGSNVKWLLHTGGLKILFEKAVFLHQKLACYELALGRSRRRAVWARE